MQFDITWNKDFYFRLSSAMMESFYDAEIDGYKFPFQIHYEVGHYEDIEADSDIGERSELENTDVSKFYEASDSDFVLVAKPSEFDDHIKSIEDIFDGESLNDTFRPLESASDFSLNASVEIIEETPKVSALSSLQSIPKRYSPNISDITVDSISSAATETDDSKLLDASRATVVKMLSNQPGIGDIIFNNFKTFSEEEKKSITELLNRETTIGNFGDLLTVANHWGLNSLKDSIVENFMVHLECEELLLSKEWAKLRTLESLYNEIAILIIRHFLRMENDFSPLFFFLKSEQGISKDGRPLELVL